MKLPWQPKDYLFSVCLTIGMMLTGLIIPKFAPAQLEIIFWAPFGAFFLTLGMARLRYWGSFTLVVLPFILLMLRFSWIIAIYLSVPLICTELLALRRGGYQIKQTRLLAIVTFFASTTFLAIVSAGIIRGGRWAVLLAQPLWLIGLTLGAMIVATIGWAIGELLVRQLWIE